MYRSALASIAILVLFVPAIPAESVESGGWINLFDGESTFGWSALGDAFRPLGARLGLVQVNSAEQWARLARLAPGLGPCPDLSGGSVVGLASTIGMPLNGRWPIHVQSVRAHEGAGLLVARFDGGSYLPDGTAYLETMYVPDLATVLVVEVNGVRFYPE